MKKLIIALFISTLFLGCATTSNPRCEQDNTFSMEFTNGSNDPYDLYINDSFQDVIAGKTKATYDIPAGNWSARAVQNSGYILYPTERTYANNYAACTQYYIVFP